jgi:hypothetical protein
MEEKLVASACFSPTGTSKGFKADYGLRLMQQGVSPTTDLFFYDFRLFSLMMPVRCIVDVLEAWEALPVMPSCFFHMADVE